MSKKSAPTKPDSDNGMKPEEIADFKAQMAGSFNALVKAKTEAGLPRHQALEVSARQLEHDLADSPAHVRALLKEALTEATAPATK